MKFRNIVAILFIVALLLTACSQAATPTTAPSPDSAQAEESPAAPDAKESPESAGAPESSEAPTADGPLYGGTMIAFVSADPKSFDPATIAFWDQSVIAPNLLEGLFRLSPDGTEIENAIAQDYTVSEDGLVWTFFLRPEAKFHNGRTVTAQDFKYSFERVLKPETASPKAWMLSKVAGAQDFVEGKASEVTGIKVIDDHTLEITLSEALAPFKGMLASVNLAVVPQEEVEKYGEDFGQNVVAAGPFTLGQWNMNSDLTINAFEGYWGGRPYLDSVKFRFIGDENTRIVEFDAGQLDNAWVPPAHWERFSTDPVYKDHMGWAHTFHTEFIAVNMEKEPFGSDVRLRQAIRYALDLDAYIESLSNRATIAHGILSPGLLGFDPDAVLYYPRNIEKAKELLADAGYEDGLPGTYDVVLPNWNNVIATFSMFQANLKEVGININIVPMEFNAYLEAIDSGNYTLAYVYRVPDYADPDGFYYPLLSSTNIGTGGNWARYSNPDVDAAIEAARMTVNDDERVALYHQVDEQFAADLPYVPLMHNIYVEVVKPYVMNYTPSPMDTTMFHRVWLDK